MPIQSSSSQASQLGLNTNQPAKSPRSHTLAFILSLISPGLGHLYAGDLFSAFCFLFLSLLVSGLLLWLILISTLPTALEVGLSAAFLVGWLYIAIDAVRATDLFGRTASIVKNRWYWYLAWIAIWAVSGFLFVPRALLSKEIFVVKSQSSHPTLQIGDEVVIDSDFYKNHEVARGDLVLFSWDDDPNRPKEHASQIKQIYRVIGLSGETVRVEKVKVWINGKSLTEPYAKWQEGGVREGNFGPAVVPEGRYFLLGDNRDHARDSRFMTQIYVEKAKILGKALYIKAARTNSERIGKELTPK